MRVKSYLLLPLLCLLLVAGLVMAQEQDEQSDDTDKQPAQIEQAGTNTATPPEYIELKKLENLYEPAWFSHQMHTNYAAEGCASCHHHNTPGPAMPACSRCHSPSIKLDPQFTVNTDGSCAACHKEFPIKPPLSIPNLKAAYHNQCMGCHREYGAGPLKCDECHSKKTKQ
ncbi:MAG: cytochrome c3 family protein [Candidatus Alcyoniella australis]|nr:cytochrome c3 family protein [Candidatus Alcyoniella australis]